MPNGLQEQSTETIAKETGQIMAEAITHPFGFIMLIAGLVVLMWAYGKFVAPARGPSLKARVEMLEQTANGRSVTTAKVGD